MKTAIQTLIDDFKESGYNLAAIKAEHYLGEEMQQIADAYSAGFEEAKRKFFHSPPPIYANPEKYFKDNYKSDEAAT
jgi:hypothetical protein